MLYALFIAILLPALACILLPAILRQEASRSWRFSFALVVALMFTATAFGLYATLGAPRLLPLIEARDARLEEVRAIIVARSADVTADPHNLAAWVELGQSFMETGQYSAAAGAFKQAVLIAQGNPALLFAYAQALISDAGGKVTDDAKQALEMALLQQPDNTEIRFWLIVRKLQDGDTQDAMQEMKTLYHSLPDDSPLKAKIDQQIGR